MTNPSPDASAPATGGRPAGRRTVRLRDGLRDSLFVFLGVRIGFAVCARRPSG